METNASYEEYLRDEDTTAVPGVVVSQDANQTRKASLRQKIVLVIGILIMVSLVTGISYYVGTRSSNRNTGTTSQKLVWNQVGDDINGPFFREFFGAGVAINENGKVIAVLSKTQKAFYEEVGGNWTLRDKICGFCNSTYGPNFVAEKVNRDSELGWGVTLSSDGKQSLLSTSFVDFGVAYVRKYSEATGRYDKMGEAIYGASFEDGFGASPSMSADGKVLTVAAIGSHTIHFFEQNSTVESSEWEQTGLMHDPKLGFFRSNFLHMSGNGNRVAYGAALEGVKVLQRQASGAWEQVGGTITSTKASNTFGASVSMSFEGDRVLIADGRMKDSEGNATGSIQVFSMNSTSDEWTKLGNEIYGKEPGDFFGYAVSISADGNRIAASARGDDGVFINGYVKIFDYNSGIWTEVGGEIIGKHLGDWFGNDLVLSQDGSRLVTGSMLFNVDDPNSFNGQVRVFELGEFA